jgi:hypothetical protein
VSQRKPRIKICAIKLKHIYWIRIMPVQSSFIKTKPLLYISILFLLNGCEPTLFGVPQSQWNQLNSSEKSQIIQGYNQKQLIDAQNAPLESAIDVAGNIIGNQVPLSYTTGESDNNTTIHSKRIINGQTVLDETKHFSDHNDF